MDISNQDQKPQSHRKLRPESRLSDYGRYSSIAVQMILIIGGGTFGGWYLDRWMGWKFPLFTLVLAMSSVALAIYLSIRDFIRKK